ncbi:ubiquinone biosynthesis protein [Nonomuraea polychroma]|uniref:Ubiquinone biosynthesis protein n=1 Tax=Nonomuraea polychroma TaxID=46176 RepID=A0A438M1V0_9ACTN|nr:AarF/UbiB family protein [Nonomuraea polychroma]RVX39765.1 ubiquinone biosynthesis protein [Nonomuraea polychroma]
MRFRTAPFLVARAFRIVLWTVLAMARVVLVLALPSRRTRAERVASEVVRLAEKLQGAFIKVGQLLGTRADLVGTTMARALGALQDDVTPMRAVHARRAAERALGPLPGELARALGGRPVASGSIACVYRAELDGLAVAVKVRRPGIERAMSADIGIVKALMRVLGRLPPLLRVPLDDIAEQLGECLIRQFDLVSERVHLERLRRDLADLPEVVVPATVPEWCGDGVITMEFIDGLDRTMTDRLPATVRETGMAVLVRAVYRMLFLHGFIHVDLHQGNAYIRRDGSVIVLDAGFTYQMTPDARLKFTEFFAGMVQGRGDECAEILLSTVRKVASGADVAGFRRDVSELIARSAGLVADRFSLSSFSVELFDLQRRHGHFADPQFVFPLLCLLAVEGAVKRHHPLMDFQLEAAPYLMHGLLTEPSLD